MGRSSKICSAAGAPPRPDPRVRDGHRGQQPIFFGAGRGKGGPDRWPGSMVELGWVPSGKLLHNYGKIHHVQWENPTISMVIFNSYVWHNQRVVPGCCWWMWWMLVGSLTSLPEILRLDSWWNCRKRFVTRTCWGQLALKNWKVGEQNIWPEMDACWRSGNWSTDGKVHAGLSEKLLYTQYRNQLWTIMAIFLWELRF